MPYATKRTSASRPVPNKGKQQVLPGSVVQAQPKWTSGKILAVISLSLIPIGIFVAYYFSRQTKVSFEFTHKMVTRPQEALIDAFNIAVTNTGDEDIIIKKLEVIQGLNGEDLYAQYKWEFMGKTLKAKKLIQWDMEFGNKNLNLLSFRVQLTTADGQVYTSPRQQYHR